MTFFAKGGKGLMKKIRSGEKISEKPGALPLGFDVAFSFSRI
jgi:hypothetical protein